MKNRGSRGLLLKDICPAKKEGDPEGTKSIRLDFVNNRQCFFRSLKGLLLCFKFKKSGYSVWGLKKVEKFFDVECVTKNSDMRCDIALQPM
jgi:hypothetical protein